ncbi:probable nucleoredoxin 1-2 [Daucus carota subsp. sativus]|uniref:probable nucleoredoxin 1-2 n=1 Tax=Daucus carota subsp. sativus TaxID=79200 RepID=UPI0007EF92CD|nr:PREDICTED: probable nucleoredoxin 1-2 isoform X1 [Daucus carota subsp. sativus]
MFFGMLSMRSLGKYILRVKFSSRLTTCATTRTLSTCVKSTIFCSFNSLHLSGIMTGGGYTECKRYHAASDHKLKWGKWGITKGDTISLTDLLFTHNRNYLVKNNHQHVKAEQLEGKVVGIYFLPLSAKNPKHSLWHTALLKDVYDDLRPVNNFEIILVACNDLDDDNFGAQIPVHPSLETDSHKVFHDLFSCMPWTAIPFSDVTSRKHVQRSFGVSEEHVFQPNLYIVDQTGMVLQCCSWSWDILEYYGSLGYPFSDKRLKFLRTEDYLATQQPCLKTLLGFPQRDYVISNNGDKIPIHTFEDKVVALYFYHPDFPDSRTEKLKLVYEEFKIKNVFEVVLVYIYEPRYRKQWRSEKLFWKSEESFWEKFKNMPWLALPFKDMCYKKLMRVFEFQCDYSPRLVIFGPHADYIEPFGFRMLHKYGIGGYPFTRKKAAELETEKIKELRWEMLWDPNTVFRRNDGSQVPFSLLSGKKVMLVLESFNNLLNVDDGSKEVMSIIEFLTKLKERYFRKKGTDDEFEVIRILVNNTESSVSKHLVGDMPWLVSPGSKLMHELDSSYFWYGRSTYDVLLFHIPIFAFSADGKLVRKTMYPTFEASEFPFYAGSLEDETLCQLITCWGLDYSNFRYNGRIYT